MRLCNFEGCEGSHTAKGFCAAHYKQFTDGKELAPVKRIRWVQIDLETLLKRGVKNGDCIEWTGCLRSGYGQLTWKGKRWVVHRLAYEFSTGESPKGLHIHHICSNRKCFNPEHLQRASIAENNLEMLARKDYEAEIARLQLRVIELEAELERATAWQRVM